jgi:holo-[acyl-carrier protein] synthase
MIHGIGTDIVEVKRIEAGLERHGRRFAERILTEVELAGFDQAAQPAAYLAKRFAAKEAAVKALGTGFRHGISLRHISIGREPSGRPTLEFNGEMASKVAEAGVVSSQLSLADEREYAVAFVVLEREA